VKRVLSVTQLSEFLAQIETSDPDYLTVYADADSFPDYVSTATRGHGQWADQITAAVESPEVVQEARRYGTGAALFWSETGEGSIIIPAFEIQGCALSTGTPEARPLRDLMEKPRRIGIVLVTWGSYALGIMEGGSLVDRKIGTGHIHKRHRKGGSSQARFARRTEDQKLHFLRRVGNRINERFGGHRFDTILLGGNRLIAGPLLKECDFLRMNPTPITTRFMSVRSADRKSLSEATKNVYASTLFTCC
jgi:hypothetical protein